MKHTTFLSLLVGLSLFRAAYADSTLEYFVTETASKPGKSQPIVIKGGKILAKGAGDGGTMDFIYSANPEQLSIIDHRKRSVMALDERQIDRFAKQTETVQPLLQGFASQLSKLNPKQRAKWEEMLGGKVSLDAISQAAQPAPTTRLVKTGRNHTVAGVSCEQVQVFEGNKQTAEICLADTAKLNLQETDYAVLLSLFGFAERLATKTQGLTKQFGVNIPNLDLHGLAGVPVEFHDVSKSKRSMTLSRINTAQVCEELMQIPEGYRVEGFKLWK
jgi:hypothetical protein